ncbi:sugar-transfer associated ATP-grasp domain-containing protein [Halomonas sp. M20]|uniref:sugar-transfer associated ATP-grasp domain-containing protein n=1 Tax=Halomonas sp. M20 TaxID=2763264 RepID=UPI001D0B2BA0|nr:sugar-transfer associated ATP-grasp domain-containing protein [Halomonas sp. M20]
MRNRIQISYRSSILKKLPNFIANHLTKSIKSYRYHQSHKKSALKALKAIENKNGKLSKETISLCDKHATEYLGDKKYAPWLYVYSAMQGQFKEGWIPDNYYGTNIVPKMDGEFSIPANLKALSNRLLKTDKLPDILYYHNGIFFEPDNYNPVTPEEAFDLLFNERDSVIFKKNNSLQGKGVEFFFKDNWDAEKMDLSNGVFQKVIKQHRFFDEIYPHPGATIRITTALDPKGVATTRAAYLRIGSSSGNSLSKHVQVFNTIRIAINLDTGELFPTGYLVDWRATDSHPDTKKHFNGLVIPNLKNALREVENLHNNYPFVSCIGWDISINENEETEIMEWNAGHNDIKFSEAVHGPNFADLLCHFKKEHSNQAI